MSASQQVAVHSAYEKKSVVRGHHVYKASWTPTVGEELPVERDAMATNTTIALLLCDCGRCHNVNDLALIRDPASITQLSH